MVLGAIALSLVVGAIAQGLVGLGLGLVAAPVIVVVAPQLMPDLMLWLALAYPALTLAREHEDIEWRGLAWALGARVPGTVAGLWLLGLFSSRTLGIAVGLMVLVSVLASVRTLRLPATPTTYAGAGFASGITGTATSIGGPPLALLLQHREPRQLRTTLAAFFLGGAALSLGGLGVTGQLSLAALLLALGYLPCLVVGYVASRMLRPRLPARQVRAAVLAICGLAGLALLTRSLL